MYIGNMMEANAPINVIVKIGVNKAVKYKLRDKGLDTFTESIGKKEIQRVFIMAFFPHIHNGIR